jgi:hypothetical protein
MLSRLLLAATLLYSLSQATIATTSPIASTRVMTEEELGSFPSTYPMFSGMLSSATLLPGLEEGYTPQGITSLSDGLVLITLYREFHVGSKEASLFAVLETDDYSDSDPSSSDDALLTVFTLQHEGQDFLGHVGGVTSVGDYVYTVDDYQLYAFSKQSILDAVELSRGARKEAPTVSTLPTLFSKYVDSKASFVSTSNGVLWVGDFYEPGPVFTIPGWHKEGWIAGYDLDRAGAPTATVTYDLGSWTKNYSVLKPDKVVFTHAGVQGAFICDDVVGLSKAFGLYNATLELYENPFAGEPTVYDGLPDDNTVSAFGLKSAPDRAVSLPTGSEDLDCDCDTKLAAVLFESASYLYRTPIRAAGGNIDDRAFTFSVDGA